MKKTGMGIMIDVDDMDWEDAIVSAKVFLNSKVINKLMPYEHRDESSCLIINALRSVAKQDCTIDQAQRVVRGVIACWGVIARGPIMWCDGWLSSGINHWYWRHLMDACREIDDANRAAEAKATTEESTTRNCERCAGTKCNHPGKRTVHVHVKQKREKSPLKNYKVQVKRTSYCELVIPAYNEDDARAIACGDKRMYDGTWASEHFVPMSSDTYLDLCDGDDAVVELTGGTE